MKMTYIEYIDRHYDPVTAMHLDIMVKNGYVDELQRVLNSMGANLGVDGIIGFRTLYALGSYNIEVVWTKMADLLTRKPPNKEKGKKQLILNFLYLYEGKKVAWLHGEKSVTMPLGSYCYAVPKGRACVYGKQLYKKYSLKYKKPAHARVLNTRITRAERQRLFDLAYEDYVDRYLNTPEAKLLDSYPKSSLSYFSVALNGGRSKGVKLLQQVIGVTADGKAGNQTLTALRRYLASADDGNLNQSILGKMAGFYKYLVHKSKRSSHYRQFAKGWCNRIKATGYRTRESRC